MTHRQSTSPTHSVPRPVVRSPATSRALGLPLTAVLALAALGLPRVVLHDLDLIQEGTAVNAVFVVVPLLTWVAVAVLGRIERPFLTLLAVGAVSGVLLALAHQALWHVSMDQASLGGNLSELPEAAQQVIMRGAAVISGVVTGTLTGALTGALSAVTLRVVRPLRHTDR